MSIITIFIILYGVFNAFITATILLKQRQRVIFIPVFLVGAVAIIFGISAQSILRYPIGDHGFDYLKVYFFSAQLVLLGVIESIRSLFNPVSTRSLFLSPGAERRSLIFSIWPWRILTLLSVAIVAILPDHNPFLGNDLNAGYFLGSLDTAFSYIRIVFCLGILFLLENVYRYAKPHERRMARITLISFAFLAVFDGIFTIRMLLFSVLSPDYIQASIIAYGICSAAGLWGLVHYRMAQRQVVISRAGVYSSVTLIFAGVLFLVLGATATLIQRMGIRFTFFEEFLAVFSIAAFLTIGISSRWVRLRIVGFLNRHIYRSRYDYRDQFFRLHQTYMAGNNPTDSVNLLLDNLTHTLGIGDVWVFFRSPTDGHFYEHQTFEQEERPPAQIKADSPLIAIFLDDDTPCIIDSPESLPERVAVASKEPLVSSRGISAVFPIRIRNEIMGLLTIKRTSHREFDKEDHELVKVFAISIGNVYAAYRMVQERSELRQFESLHHITSFIIHDIKNQVATLTLLSRNAQSNISNPEFQQSLVRSIKECAENLQGLIDKLSMPTRQGVVRVREEDINTIVEESLESTGVRLLPDIRIEMRLDATTALPLDRTATVYVLNNIVKNAIEAMKESGTITIVTGDCHSMPQEIKNELSIGEQMLTGKRVFVLVRDTGPGMTNEFLRQKLFHPFSSTKDKGIGIGLFQSKTLIEQMGGLLLCSSRLGAGTAFCCIL